jgi:hypothetical protein
MCDTTYIARSSVLVEGRRISKHATHGCNTGSNETDNSRDRQLGVGRSPDRL